MAPLTSTWRRLKASLANEIQARTETSLADHAEREVEVLRQLADVFKELALLSQSLGDIGRAVAALERQLAEIRETVGMNLDVDGQSTELLGRLLASTRARLEAVEEAVRSSP